MNRSDLVRAAAAETKSPLKNVEEILEVILETIRIGLACGETVTIRNFGKFEPRDQKPRKRKMPDGSIVECQEVRRVGFLAAPALKRGINRSRT